MTNDERTRYERQIKIDDWGEAGQERLRKGRVLIAGLGGLGGPAAYYLAAAGAGRLLLWDRDRVELSNLNRQILYGETDRGRGKAETAAGRLRSLNSGIEVEAVPGEIGREALDARAGDFDLIVDCLDNFETRFLLNRWAVERGVPLVHGGVRAMQGQATVVMPGEGPCLECLFGGMDSERGTPVLGAAVGTVGTLLAVEALKLLTGMGRPLIGRMLIFDGLAGAFREMEVAREPDCPVCGHPEQREPR
jgi:adenylyltransferase/sulfurtransferase